MRPLSEGPLFPFQDKDSDPRNRFILRHRVRLCKLVKKIILDKKLEMQYLDLMDFLVG